MKRSVGISITIFILLVVGLAAAYNRGYLKLEAAAHPADTPVANPAAKAENAAQAAPVNANQSMVVVDAKVAPAQSAELSFAQNGVIQQIFVREGDFVQAGQVLAKLDPRDALVAVSKAEADLKNAQASLAEVKAGARTEEIAQAQAVLDAAQARLDKLKANGDIAAYQAAVAQAQANLQQVLDGTSEQQLIKARAELFNAKATLQQAQSAYNKVAWKPDIGAQPESANLQTATNNYEAAQANYTDLQNGPTAARVASARAQVSQAAAQLNSLKAQRPADIAAYEAEVRNASANLTLLKQGARPEKLAQAEAQVAVATAALQQQLVALSKTELRAPITGTVASLDMNPGEQATANKIILRLADLRKWQLETKDLTEVQVVHLQEGSQGKITFDALPGVELTGKVLRIRPYGDTSSGDIVYRATLVIADLQEPRLRWNMTAAVSFQ